MNIQLAFRGHGSGNYEILAPTLFIAKDIALLELTERSLIL